MYVCMYMHGELSGFSFSVCFLSVYTRTILSDCEISLWNVAYVLFIHQHTSHTIYHYSTRLILINILLLYNVNSRGSICFDFTARFTMNSIVCLFNANVLANKYTLVILYVYIYIFSATYNNIIYICIFAFHICICLKAINFGCQNFFKFFITKICVNVWWDSHWFLKNQSR